MKLNYSEQDWSLTKTCDSYESCIVIFNNNVDSSTSFTIYTQSVSQLKNKCNCNSLLEFVQDDYQTTYNQPQITILNDSQIVIGNNISAWQMDYLTTSEMKELKHIITWTSSNQIYYRFSYHSPNEIDKILNDNNKLIQSIKFFQPLENNLPPPILEKQPIKKQPSFMTKNTKTNNTFEKLQSQFKNETDSKKHELLVHDNVQFRDTESDVKKDLDINSAYNKFKDSDATNPKFNTEKVYSSTQFRDIDQEADINTQSVDMKSGEKKLDIYTAYNKLKDTEAINLESAKNKITANKITSNEKEISQSKQKKFNHPNTSQAKVNWLTYENPTFGISIKYPDNWTYENQDEYIDKAIYRAGDINGESSIVDFIIPNINNDDSTLHVSFYNLPKDTSLEKFVKGEIKDLSYSKIFGFVSQWEVLKRNSISVSNVTAEKVVYRNIDPSSSNDKLVIYVVINGKGYSFEYTDTFPLPFKDNVAIIEKMVNKTTISTSTALDDPIQWATFNDKGLGISLEHPLGWEIQQKENKFDEGPEVTISDTSANTGEIKILKPTQISSLYDAELATIMAKNAVNDNEDTRIIEEIDMGVYQIGGKEAGTFLYSLPNPLSDLITDTNTKSLFGEFLDEYAQQMVVTVYKKKMYVFVFQASTPEFESYKETMDHIFRSIKFLN